jgi:hypothetical protein
LLLKVLLLKVLLLTAAAAALSRLDGPAFAQDDYGNGKFAYRSFTGENLREKQPVYYKWLGELFGVQKNS